jgi:hypothetical protein
MQRMISSRELKYAEALPQPFPICRIWHDKDVSGQVLILGDLVALAGIFVYGRDQAHKG